MDTGRGEFAELSEGVAEALEKKDVNIFRTGEVLEIKGSKFRIQNFDKNFLILELLKK